jgi:tetratricopeptide (TPR) repeat protein
VELTPAGNAPDSLNAGIGFPVALIVKLPAWPAVNVAPAELRRQLNRAVRTVSDYVQKLFGLYVDALEHQDAGEAGAAVASLLAAGRLEERIGRAAQAEAWYVLGLGIAAGLQDRRPEVGALDVLGHLCLVLSRYEDSARHYQRALALAEAEFDQSGAIAACLGIGAVALERGEWPGVQAWYNRALRQADASGDDMLLGRIHHALGELSRRQGDASAVGEHLREARERLEAAGDEWGVARVLNTQGQAEAAMGRGAAATAAYREALAWVRRGEGDPALEVSIRLNLSRQQMDAGQLLEAEAEIRRAEQFAIGASLMVRLVEIYTLFGRLRGRQKDETGFVFFEQAVQLARHIQAAPLVEAQIYYEYGVFKEALGQAEEARAYLERAQELLVAAGGHAELERVKAELGRLTA